MKKTFWLSVIFALCLGTATAQNFRKDNKIFEKTTDKQEKEYLQFLYDYLSGGLTDEGDIHDRADCNSDGSVDILDYQQLYQLLTAPQEG